MAECNLFRQRSTVELSGRVAEKHIIIFSSTNQIKFLISLWGNLCDSWTPSSFTYVWPLSEAWQPCHSRGQDNPKDVSSPLKPPWERLWSPLQLHTHKPHQWKHSAQTGQPCMTPEIGQDQNLCVKTKRLTADLVILLREYAVFHFCGCCVKCKAQISILLVVFLWFLSKGQYNAAKWWKI